ncbi:MAG: hypothetical protein ACI90V_008285, partial [Bacillariaceae sp.]
FKLMTEMGNGYYKTTKSQNTITLNYQDSLTSKEI